MAGGHRAIYEGRALLALHRGEYERALHMQRCAVFDISDPSASSTSVSGFMQQQAGVASDRDCLLGTLELLLSTAGRSRKVAKDVGRMRGWARVLLEALPEDGTLQITELGPIIAASGRAGQSFARALQLERGATGSADRARRSR